MRRLTLRALLGLLAASVALLGLAGTAPAATKKCPNTFRVLHDDHIGKLALQKGHYRLILLQRRGFSCSRAANQFRRFLEDYDGKLPGAWKVRPRRSSFVRGNSGVGFKVRRRSGGRRGGGGGRHPANGGRRCPNTFEVLHNDRIGELRLPKGEYHITRLTPTSPSCDRAAKLFAKFLEDTNGDLPPNWRLGVRRAAFIKRGSGGDGFRVKPVR